MTHEQTLKLLRLMANVWTNLAVTDDVVSAWHFVLADENPAEVLAAARYLAKTQGKEKLAPNPPSLIATIAELRNPLGCAELAWSHGPKNPQNDFDAQIWRIWGGYERFANLPDPVYAEDSTGARREIAFARKEFLDLYKNQREIDTKGSHHLTHSDSVKSLENMQSLGIQTKKLLGFAS